MPFILTAAENCLIIIALPWLISDGARELLARIDDRGMFAIPFCRSLAIASGCLLTIATGVLADFTGELSPASLWEIYGFWHESRFLGILAVYAGKLSWVSYEAVSLEQRLFAESLVALAIVLTTVNFIMAAFGWRSPAALRGLIAHGVIVLSVWIVLTIGVLAALWVLHWLNFWIFLVLTIVVEMRRREVGVTKLSF